MSNPQALKSLLFDLKRVRSPVQRMKLLALGWRTVRELSPEERDEIASELGMKHLSGLLDRLGKKENGIAPAEVLQVLEQADDDPVKLGALVAGLRDPARRKELLRRGVGVLDRMLQDETETVAETEAAAETEPAVPHGADVVPDDTLEGEPPPADSPPLPVVESAVIPDLPADAEAVAATIASPPTLPDEDTEIPHTDEPFVIDAASITVSPVPALPDLAIDPTAMLARLVSAPTLTRRFRVLRELLDEGCGLGGIVLGPIVDSFPDGWARRRALNLLLLAGLPKETGEALTLIDRLTRPTDQRWCALTVLETRELILDDTERIERRFPFPVVKRRIRALARSA